MTPRPYQIRAVERARLAYAEGSRAICIVAPTGAGKTKIGTMIAENALQRGGVLWIAHRHELIAQARAKLPREVKVATVQGLLASGERPEARLVVLDEAAHYVASEWNTVAEDYRNALIIGLTATPERSDGRALDDLFTSLVVAAHYSELLAGGWLVPCDVYAPTRRKELAMPVTEAVQRWGRGRQGIVFCDTVKAAMRAANEIDNAAVIHGGTPWLDRQARIGRFLNGDLDYLTSVYVLTEGFDAPNASLCVLGRGASHPSTYLQMVGRVLRPAPGKDRAVLVDLCGSFHDHGHPTEDREYSLTGKAIKRAKAEPLWGCKVCGLYLATPPGNRICPSCGSVLPEPPELAIQRRRVERQEYHRRATPEQRQQAYEVLKKKAAAKGYRPTWARHVYRARYGSWPVG